MVIICSSGKDGDVLNGIRQARKTKTSIIPMQGIAILQVGKALYNDLEKKRRGVNDVLRKRVASYKVNAKTLMLHRTTCKCPLKNELKASIVNPAKTGLRLCKRCISK